jgi:hypothetical protein
VVAVSTPEGLERGDAAGAGVEIVAVAAAEALAERVPAGVAVLPGGRISAVEGRKGVRSVTVSTAVGSQRFECDTAVLSLGLTPRDALLRMGTDLPVSGAGDVVWPGCDLE